MKIINVVIPAVHPPKNDAIHPPTAPITLEKTVEFLIKTSKKMEQPAMKLTTPDDEANKLSNNSNYRVITQN
jgi:hypothetical protein